MVEPTSPDEPTSPVDWQGTPRAPAAPAGLPLAASELVFVVMSLGHLIGSDGGSWYNFWSGMGADIGGLTLLAGGVAVYRKHNCHIAGCWRIAKQQVVGTSWVVCHHHHPAGRPTAEQVAEVHSRILNAEHAALERAERLRHPEEKPESPRGP